MYDRSIKAFDEPHSPEKLDQMRSDSALNKGKFLIEAHSGSYLTSMQTIRKTKVTSVLEVGPGEGFVARNMASLGITFDTLDFEGANNPTIQADFSKFDPTPYAGKYEMTCAFQVLEHFPFEDFPRLMEKLATLSSKYVLISLPYSCRGFRLRLRVHQGQSPRWNKVYNFYRPTDKPNRKYRPEYMQEFPWAVHYWEIGRKGFKLDHVLDTIAGTGLKVTSRFHGPNPYHYYMLCEK